MSTALLEPPVITAPVPAEKPLFGADFTGWTVSEISFVSSPQVAVKSFGTEWTNFGAIQWASGGPMDPYKPVLGSFYYGGPARSTRSPVELGRLLRDAAARVEIYGWVQGTFRDELGRVCAFGALRMAGASDWELEVINQAACKLLGQRGELDATGGPYRSIPRWNDAPGRTAVQVTALLRAVAEAYEADPSGGSLGCPCGAAGCRYSERVSVGI